MPIFEKLRSVRAFQKQHHDLFSTVADRHLIGEIGYYQAKRKPLTLKQLSLLGVSSTATVQRRLRRLKELGLVHQRRAAADRRAVELTLSPKCLRIFEKYEALIDAKLASDAACGNGGPSHVCGLCDGDASCRDMLAGFLAEGLKRGDKCVLVAPAKVQNDIVGGLNQRRKAPRHVIVSEGYDSNDAQVEFLKRLSREAKRAGQTLCLAADMSWVVSKALPIEAVLDIETRFDALARKLPLKALCVYDTRHFSGGDFLRAVKCHHDHSRHPIVLG